MTYPDWYIKAAGKPVEILTLYNRTGIKYSTSFSRTHGSTRFRVKVVLDKEHTTSTIKSTKFIVTIVGLIPNEPTVEAFLASASSGASWSIGFFSPLRTRGHAKQLPLKSLPEGIDTPRKAMLFALDAFQEAPKELERDKQYLCRLIAEIALTYFGNGVGVVDLDKVYHDTDRELEAGTKQELDRDQADQQLEQLFPRPTPILDKMMNERPDVV